MTGDVALLVVFVSIVLAAAWTLWSAARVSRTCQRCYGRGWVATRRGEATGCDCPAGQAWACSRSDDPDWPLG